MIQYGGMNNWRLWIGVSVSVLCLYLAARGIEFSSLLEALRQVQVVWLLLALGPLVLVDLARAYRWRLLFHPLSELSIWRLFRLVSIGYLVSSVTPMRLGEVLRVYLCAQTEQVDVARALSTVVLERVSDTLTITLLLLALVPSVAIPAELVRPAVAVGIVAAFGCLFLATVVVRRQHAFRLYDRLAGALPVLGRPTTRRIVVSAVDGLAALSSRRQTAGLGAWSLAIWLVTAVVFGLVMLATGLRLPFAAALLVACVTSLGMIVPSSPGYLGIFEYLTVLSVSLFGVDRGAALSYALVLHAVLYLKSVVLGLIALWIEGYSYAHLRDTLTHAQANTVPT